jgi:thiol-disulfide isomerase/thioredoxin
VALVVASCGGGAAGSACGANVAVTDRPLPAADVTLLDDSPSTLAELTGDGTAVVNLWGSWCGPCRSEAPELVAAEATLAPRGVRFAGIDVRDDKASATQFERRFGITWPSAFDADSSLSAQLTNAPSPPVTLIVSDGRIRREIIGETDRTALVCAVDDVTSDSGDPGGAS